VLGEVEATGAFVRSSPFSLEARPLPSPSPSIGKGAGGEGLPPSPSIGKGAGGEGLPPSPSIGKGAGGEGLPLSPSLGRGAGGEGFEPPELEVIYTLEALASTLAPPYVVVFEIDPQMNGPSQQHTFPLKGQDTTANVNYTSNNGEVWAELFDGNEYTQSPAGSSGALSIARVPVASQWTVKVNRASGNPYYTLRGDITVN